jgi:predicted amidohydrolase YtcJ
MQSARALERDARGRPVLVETHIHAIIAGVTLWLRLNTSSQPACAGPASGET